MRLFGTDEPAYVAGPGASPLVPGSSGSGLSPSPSYNGGAAGVSDARGADLLGVFPSTPSYVPAPAAATVEASRSTGVAVVRKG